MKQKEEKDNVSNHGLQIFEGNQGIVLVTEKKEEPSSNRLLTNISMFLYRPGLWTHGVLVKKAAAMNLEGTPTHLEYLKERF